MRRLAAAILLAAASPSFAQAPVAPATAAVKPQFLPAGAQLELRTTTPLSSERNVKGDLVTLEVVEDLLLDGAVAVPAGTPAVGQVTLAERKTGFGIAGALAVELLWVELGGSKVRVTGRLRRSGDNETGEAALANAIAGLAFLAKGDEAVIPAGSAVTAELSRDVRLP